MKNTLKKAAIILLIVAIFVVAQINVYAAAESNTEVEQTEVEQTEITEEKESEQEELSNIQDGDLVEPEEMEMIYPILIDINGYTVVEVMSGETLDKLYKEISDNIDKTYITIDENDIISFDSNTTYKITDEFRVILEKVVEEEQENMPNIKKFFDNLPKMSKVSNSSSKGIGSDHRFNYSVINLTLIVIMLILTMNINSKINNKR